MGTESNKKSDKEICEICGEKIGLTRAKVKEGFGDRVVCFFCLKDGKAALNCQKCGREFYPQEKSLKILPLCPDCREALNKAQAEAGKESGGKKKGSSSQKTAVTSSVAPKKKGKLGILVGLVVVAIGLFLIFGSGSESIEIQGTTAKCVYEAIYTESKDSLGFNLARLAYKAATKSDQVQDVVIQVTLSGAGLNDKYGNPIKGRLELGTIAYKVTEETRKYKDADSFTLRNKQYFKNQVRTLKQSHLFEDD